MIRQHFSMFSGVGPKREQTIREAEISDWQQFLDSKTIAGLSDRVHRPLRQEVRKWSKAVERGDVDFLVKNLPRAEHWMLFELFGDSVRYLDIETTGLSARHDDVTVVGIYDGQRFHALVKGQGLSSKAIRDALGDCKLLVTYFGSVFDVPFLRVNFPELHLDLPHFDLCFAGRKVGLSGGLKTVERTLGLARDDSIAEVDGFEAVRLWRAHQRGNPTALKTLVDYNEADTRNLAHIASVIYGSLSRPAEGE